MSTPIKLVTRSEQQTSAKVIEKLRKVIEEIESGNLKGTTMVVVVTETEADDGKCFYALRSSGMTNSQALWLLEHGKHTLLHFPEDNG